MPDSPQSSWRHWRLGGWFPRIADRVARDDLTAPGAWLTRFVILRLLGLVYLMAFLTLVNQGPALLGRHGLLPLGDFLDAVVDSLGSRGAGFAALPSIFWLGTATAALLAVGWVGVVLSVAVLLGYANALILAVLCALQISISNVGQTFYAFGWEIQLVETGFLCIFLCPLLDGRPFPAPPAARDHDLAPSLARRAHHVGRRPHQAARRRLLAQSHLSRLPLRDAAHPKPAHALFHALPHWAHTVGVVFNHVVELGAPFLVFGPRRARLVGGALMAALQLVLIASGNLSFLNWLTLVPILACFDDHFWRRMLPAAVIARADAARAAAVPSRVQGTAVAALTVGIALLSIPPVLNMLSGRQVMNTSFTSLPIVNTYGAFGTVGRERLQLVLEGTTRRGDHGRDPLGRLPAALPAGGSRAPPLLDEPLPPPARLAAVVRRHGHAARVPVGRPPRREAPRRRRPGAVALRLGSVRGHAAAPRARRALPLQAARSARARVLGAHARGLLAAAPLTRQPRAPRFPVPQGLARRGVDED
jgi:hypothetical protein